MHTPSHTFYANSVAISNGMGVVRVVNPLVILRGPVVLLVLGLVIINLLLG